MTKHVYNFVREFTLIVEENKDDILLKEGESLSSLCNKLYQSYLLNELKSKMTKTYNLRSIKEYIEDILLPEKRFARVCSVTGEGMNAGWIDEGSYKYFKNQKDAVGHVKSILINDTDLLEDKEVVTIAQFHELSDEEVLDIAYRHYDMYWTEWEVEGEETWYTKDGVEMTECYGCKEITSVASDYCEHCHKCIN